MTSAGKLVWEAGFNSSGLVSGMSLAARAMADMQTKAASFVGRMDGSFTSISKKASTSAKAFESAFADQRAAMQRLIDAADPTAAGLRRIAAAEAEVNRALASGAITAQEHALIMGNMARISGTTGKGFSNLGVVVQQAGFQIADVAAVAAAGGNAFAAVGTQLGQFLGSVAGPMGAVIGAAVTIMGLFVTKLFKAGDAAESAKKSAELYEESLKSLLDVEKQYNAALTERQGINANGMIDLDSIKALKDAAFEARKAATLAKDKGATLPIFSVTQPSIVGDLAFDKFTGRGTLWGKNSQERYEERKGAIEDLERAADAAEANLKKAVGLQDSTKKEKYKTVLGDINAEYERESVLLKVAASERDRARAMMDAELQVREKLKEVASKPEDVELQVQIAREHAAAVFDQERAEEAQEEALKKKTRAREKDLQKMLEQEEARQKISEGMQQELADNGQLIAALQASEAEYERVKALLDAVNQYRRAGLEMTPDEVTAAEQAAQTLGAQREQLDALKDKYESLKKLGADMGMTFSSAFEDAVVGGKKLSETLQGLYQDVLRLMVRQSITQPLASSAGSWFSSIFSTIGFAAGTNKAPPGMAWVGEKGPELVDFDGGEKVYPHGLSKQIASAYSLPGFANGAYDALPAIAVDDSGAAGLEVNVINNAGADVKTQRRVVGGRESVDIILDQKVAKHLSQRGSGSNRALRQTFGASEKLVSR